jgi:NAD(P)-dependent dehydrogenase (short-subunit alcohol dehydrogenase family)
MDLQLSGKRALVTGSTLGTGAAIARALAAEGAHVVVHGRNRQRAEAVAGQILRQGGKAGIALGDLSSMARASQVAQKARDVLGGIDILVNNAALIGHYETWDDTQDKDWLHMYEGVVVVI